MHPEVITLHIEKKAESAGALNAYIYLTMDAQLKNLVWRICFCYILKMFLKEPHTALFIAPMKVGKLI